MHVYTCMHRIATTPTHSGVILYNHEMGTQHDRCAHGFGAMREDYVCEALSKKAAKHQGRPCSILFRINRWQHNYIVRALNIWNNSIIVFAVLVCMPVHETIALSTSSLCPNILSCIALDGSYHFHRSLNYEVNVFHFIILTYYGLILKHIKCVKVLRNASVCGSSRRGNILAEPPRNSPSKKLFQPQILTPFVPHDISIIRSLILKTLSAENL